MRPVPENMDSTDLFGDRPPDNREKYLCVDCGKTFWADPMEVGEFGMLCDGEEPVCPDCKEYVR